MALRLSGLRLLRRRFASRRMTAFLFTLSSEEEKPPFERGCRRSRRGFV